MSLQTISAVNATNNTLTITSHGLALGTAVQVLAVDAGALPAPLAEETPYYAIPIDSDTFKLAASAVGAINGWPIDLSSVGSGSFVLMRIRA